MCAEKREGDERSESKTPDRLEAALSAGRKQRRSAREPERSQASGAIANLFLFETSGLRLATQAAYVEAVAECQDPTPVPGCPDYVMGVVPHGEEILPMVDLARLLGLPEDGAADPLYRRGLVVRTKRFFVGLVVDRARGLVQIPVSRMKPASALQGQRLTRFLDAEIEDEAGPIGVLDVPALLRAAAVT